MISSRAYNPDILNIVRKSAKKKILFLPHAVRQMSKPNRMISIADIRRVIKEGEIIEDYPEDARGHSCLIFGKGKDGQVIHVVCSPKEDYLAIITAYLPHKQQWEKNLKKRKQP